MTNQNSKNFINILLITLFIILVLIIGASYWVYSSGYYHAFRGGLVEDSSREDALAFYKIAYSKNNNAFMVAHDIACCYSVLKNKEESFRWLAITLNTTYSDFAREYAKNELDFAFIKDDIRFERFLNNTLKIETMGQNE